MTDEIVQKVGRSGFLVANNVTFGMVPVVETEVVALKANLKKAREQAAPAKAELDKLHVASESIAK